MGNIIALASICGVLNAVSVRTCVKAGPYLLAVCWIGFPYKDRQLGANVSELGKRLLRGRARLDGIANGGEASLQPLERSGHW